MAFPSRVFSLMMLLMAVLLQMVHSEPIQDKQALQDFMGKVPHSPRVKWNASTSACDWYGVFCDASRSYVSALRLPGVGLLGQIPDGTIGRLSNLRVLSLHSNGLYGPIPADFSNLTRLRSLYIQRNQLSGEFPAKLIQLRKLSRLDLSTNSFSGELPSVGGGTLTAFNVSNNHLNGSIPRNFAKFPDSSFMGNLQLCGSPLPACNSSSSIVPSSPAVRSHRKLSTVAIAAIIVAGVVVILTLLICLVLCLIRRRREHPSKSPKHAAAVSRAVGAAAGGEGTSSSKDDLTSGAVEGERSKLVFVNNVAGAGAVYSFDLEDLLRASAEVLGKGGLGTSYKAVLEDGTTVVVKRLKDVAAAKREFDMQMEVLGSCRHENLVPLRAFYFSKDEKLLVYDYFPAGSLSSLLHGSRGSGKTPLNWDSRMKLALGTARGLSYLHVSGKVVHGNIKSSNILVRPDHQEGVVGDFGLNPLFGSSGPPHRQAGYRAPEVVESRKVTFMSDVYSFGVLLLEMLTGKSPNQASLGEEGIDLPRWVQSVVREEWTAEVFDAELMRFGNIEEEMVQLLQIAMSCVQTVPDQRPAMPQVLRMMEDISRTESESGLRQSSDDPSKGSGGQTPPAEITPTSSLTP